MHNLISNSELTDPIDLDPAYYVNELSCAYIVISFGGNKSQVSMCLRDNQVPSAHTFIEYAIPREIMSLGDDAALWTVVACEYTVASRTFSIVCGAHDRTNEHFQPREHNFD